MVKNEKNNVEMDEKEEMHGAWKNDLIDGRGWKNSGWMKLMDGSN